MNNIVNGTLIVTGTLKVTFRLNSRFGQSYWEAVITYLTDAGEHVTVRTPGTEHLGMCIQHVAKRVIGVDEAETMGMTLGFGGL